jgi:hypothetical protein
MGSDLEDFFSRLDPKYSKYAVTLGAAGVTTLSEVPDFAGLLGLEIPAVDAVDILVQLAKRDAARKVELAAGGMAQSRQRC